MTRSVLSILLGLAVTFCGKADSIWWSASWSANGTYLAIGGDAGSLLILNAKDLSVYREYRFDSTTIAAVSWHPHEDVIALVGYSHHQKPTQSLSHLIDIRTNQIIKLGESAFGGRGLAWSTDGRHVAMAGDGEIRIFSKSGKEVRHILHPAGRSLFALAWHPKENKLAVAEEDIRIYDTDTGKELFKIKTSDKPKGVMCLAWHPSGKILASGDYGHENEGEPSYLKFWDDLGRPLKIMKGSQSVYRGLKWNRGGTRLFTASDSLRIWSREGNLLETTNVGRFDLWGIDWNEQNDQMVTVGNKGIILIWDSSGALLQRSHR